MIWNHISVEKVGKGLLEIGIGGFIAYFFIQFMKLKLLPLSVELNFAVMNGTLPDVKIEIAEAAVFMISVFVLLIAPLFIHWNKSAGLKIVMLLFVFFADIGGVMTVVVRGEIFTFFIFVIWFSAIYITWLCFGIGKILYAWVKTSSADPGFDIVKLTFVWTIIAFIIGKVW